METRKRVVSVAEVAEALGVSRSSAYEAIARGDIPHRRLGKRIIIPREAFERWLAADSSNEAAA